LSDGQFTTIDVPGASLTIASGINSRGDIVGRYHKNPDGLEHGYLVIGTTSPRLMSLARPSPRPRHQRHGDIIGVYVADGFKHRFLLRGDEFTSIDVPRASGIEGWRINPRGEIVGSYVSAGGTHEYRAIDVRGAPSTIALGINIRGDIVGRYNSPGAWVCVDQEPSRVMWRVVSCGGSKRYSVALSSSHCRRSPARNDLNSGSSRILFRFGSCAKRG
jgi:hypothetical protein